MWLVAYPTYFGHPLYVDIFERIQEFGTTARFSENNSLRFFLITMQRFRKQTGSLKFCEQLVEKIWNSNGISKGIPRIFHEQASALVSW